MAVSVAPPLVADKRWGAGKPKRAATSTFRTRKQLAVRLRSGRPASRHGVSSPGFISKDPVAKRGLSRLTIHSQSLRKVNDEITRRLINHAFEFANWQPINCGHAARQSSTEKHRSRRGPRARASGGC